MKTGQKTTDGKEIEIRKTGNDELTDRIYTVYVGSVKIAGGCTGREAREVAEGLTKPLSDHVAEMMDLNW